MLAGVHTQAGFICTCPNLQTRTCHGAQVRQGMGPRTGSPALQELLVLLFATAPAPGQAVTDAQLLLHLKASFSNAADLLPDWKEGTDPCGDKWTGVVCTRGARIALL